MTLPLRRKRPTTVPAASTRARKAVELAGILGLLLGGVAQAQQPEAASSFASSRPRSAPVSATILAPPVAAWEPPATGTPESAFPLIQRVVMQQPRDGRLTSDEAAIQDITIQLEPPGPDRLFRLEGEKALHDRMRQEAKQRTPPETLIFPEEPILSREAYPGRKWPVRPVTAEAYYVWYDRLLFEQINFERYGWDLGPTTPFISAGAFFKDIAFLPYHVFTDPFRQFEYNNGYCLPGDPTPLYLYPPEISFTGAVAEAATVLAILAILP